MCPAADKPGSVASAARDLEPDAVDEEFDAAGAERAEHPGSFDPGVETGYLRRGGRDHELPLEIGAAPFDPGPDHYDDRRAKRAARKREKAERRERERAEALEREREQRRREEAERLEREQRERAQAERTDAVAAERAGRERAEAEERERAKAAERERERELAEAEERERAERQRRDREARLLAQRRERQRAETARAERARAEGERLREAERERIERARREREREERERAERKRVERKRAATRPRAAGANPSSGAVALKQRAATSRTEPHVRLKPTPRPARARPPSLTGVPPGRGSLRGPTVKAGLALTAVIVFAMAAGSLLGLPVPLLDSDAEPAADTSAGDAALLALDGGTPTGLTKGPYFPVVLDAPAGYGEEAAKFHADRGGRKHEGQDVFAKPGTPLVAVRDGIVLDGSGGRNFYSTGGGNTLVIYSPIDNRSYVYLHMLKPALVAAGENVTAGQPVGQVGCTGSCDGPHLHFEVRNGRADFGAETKAVDPLPLLKQWPQRPAG